jgi:hypothetical protein
MRTPLLLAVFLLSCTCALAAQTAVVAITPPAVQIEAATPERKVDLRVTRSVLRGEAQVGGKIAYTLTVTNAGNLAAREVLLDEWSGGYQFLDLRPSQGAARLDPAHRGRARVFLGEIPAGNSATVEVSARASAHGRQVTTSAVESSGPERDPRDNEGIFQDTIRLAGLNPAPAPPPPASSTIPVASHSIANDSGGTAALGLLADGGFDDPAGWQQSSWRPRPAKIVSEGANPYLQISVPDGSGEDVFAPARIPPDHSTVRVRFRARCTINATPENPALMLLIGDKKRSQGKPVKLAVSPEWRVHEVTVRFQARAGNNQFKIQTLTSPLAVDLDDFEILSTPLSAQPPATPADGL